MKQILSTLICLGLAAAFAPAQNSFYAQPPLFSYSPDETKSLTTIKHLGPVGMGIDMIQPAFRHQVLKMATKKIGGINYLFNESGGFGPKNPPGWKPNLLVFQPQ